VTLTAAQLEMRRTGITATDIAAIVGEHPYRGPIDVWLDKMGESEPSAGTPASDFGALWAEPFLRSWYSAQHGDARIDIPGTMRHIEHAHHLATPDGLVWATPLSLEPGNGLEVKAHGWSNIGEYGEPGTDHVPRYELLQCAWGMHVAELPRWDLVRLDVPPVVYTITRDLELETMLCEEADRFWRDHVVTRTPPPPDGTARYSGWLARRYPHSAGGTVQADAHLYANAMILRSLRRKLEQVQRDVAERVQAIQAAMGDAEILDLGAERITWKTCAGKTKWKAVAEALASRLGAQDLLTEMAEQHKTPGERRFHVPRSWAKDEHE
jgi:putative phage-type endonuclease